MKLERALDIVNSLGVIDVTYENNSVWIENVNGIDNTANIKDLKTEEVKRVSVFDLMER